jgi:hypothetical protein
MGRPKGSKNKPKTAPPKVKAKAKAKAKAPEKSAPPDWLRKAMAVKPAKPKVGRKPTALKAKFKAIATKARRGKTMAKQPVYDPLDDPDFRAGVEQLPAEEQVKVPEEKRQQMKGTKLTEEQEPEPAPLFDEVAAGAEVPWENVQALIASTLGGGGDAHASADACVRRMKDDANWVMNKGADGTPAGMAIKARKDAEEKARKEREAEAKGKEAKGKDAKK